MQIDNQILIRLIPIAITIVILLVLWTIENDKAKAQSQLDNFDIFIRTLEEIMNKRVEPLSHPVSQEAEQFNEIVRIQEEAEKLAMKQNKQNYLQLKTQITAANEKRYNQIQLLKIVTGVGLIVQMILLLL
jgi:hypothetical protein